jgi:hypothetical protein
MGRGFAARGKFDPPRDYKDWYAGNRVALHLFQTTASLRRRGPNALIERKARPPSLRTSSNMVAWDFSRAAARAITDAMPVLEKAKQVRVVTVLNEKALDTRRSAEEVAKNLSRHGIDVILDAVDAAARPIGEVLESHAASCGADVLVMGDDAVSLSRCTKE